MFITREYIYRCRACGEKFHKVTAAEANPALGSEKVLVESEERLQNQFRSATHRCLNGRVIGLGDLVGVFTHEKASPP